MLWLRGCIFTMLVPFLVGLWVPWRLLGNRPLAPGGWQAGWLLLGAGVALYGWCLLLFLLSGGTPAIFFTRHQGFLIGTEPERVVRGGPYRFSRNPMYVAVTAAVLGQALIYRSAIVFAYGAILMLVFHLVVVLLEEPHLHRTRGPQYNDYLRTVRRWL
jgi:protein-S-isoprenylcysteine O-methyltransferase Ste14